jgi:acetyltransferase-like isoleucine patch superfamily enzyme
VIVIGDRVEIAPGTSLLAADGGTLIIGDDVFVGPRCNFAASGHVAIGEASMIAEDVTIRDHDHDPAMAPRSGRMLQADVRVGHRVWIAAKASVGRGVTIGDDAVVAAHAFVSRDVPADSLVGGVPARVLRQPIKRRSGSS